MEGVSGEWQGRFGSRGSAVIPGQDRTAPVVVERAVRARMRISALSPADSPRRVGVDEGHVRALAETEAALPPILVHRPTSRVIDGMHRLQAAVSRGDHEIEVEYFDGCEDDAFVRAVQANVVHGLPLSQADREAAAIRILSTHPQWSDRVIAVTTGQNAKTVAAIRRRLTEQIPQLNARVGRDGRVRPLNSAEGRRIASETINQRPDASLREIAKMSGVSLATVRDVRERIRRGDDPVPKKVRDEQRRRAQLCRESVTLREKSSDSVPSADQFAALQRLRQDPSLRLSATGRSLLQWLGIHTVDTDSAEEFIRAIPPHCADIVVDLARGCAEKWQQFAEELDKRKRNAG